MSSEEKSPSLIFAETRSRSLVKAIVYRVISLAGTTAISWLITRDFTDTLVLTLSIQAFLVLLYYLSERVWNRIAWGKQAMRG